MSSLLLFQPQIWTSFYHHPNPSPGLWQQGHRNGSRGSPPLHCCFVPSAKFRHSYTRISYSQSLPKKCIGRAPSTCRLLFAAAFALHPTGFLLKHFLHLLFSADASVLCAEVVWFQLFNAGQFICHNHDLRFLLGTFLTIFDPRVLLIFGRKSQLIIEWVISFQCI